MYIASFRYKTDNVDYFFSTADSALQFIRHIVNKEESYYECGKPTSIELYRVLPIDSLAQCANAISTEMWKDPDYWYNNIQSEPLAIWHIDK